MRSLVYIAAFLLIPGTGTVADGEATSFHSPGFPPSQMEAEGQLVEDWGKVTVQVSGEGLEDGPTKVEKIKLDGIIPAARAVSPRGPIKLTSTAYRAPAFPTGVDVLTVRVEETKGQPAQVNVMLKVDPSAQVGMRTVRIGSRTVLTLPSETVHPQELLDWGYCDEAVSMPGWAKPKGECDPAFKNIRAGMGGVPIQYRFTVVPGSEANVVLGFCESHWAETGRRPLVCRVEGAAPKEVDPVAKWGQHQPGVLLFRARDDNRDGRMEVAVRTPVGAPDRNPILNAVWVFPKGEAPKLDKVLAGDLSRDAIRYVDVGGQNDQSVFPPGKLDYRLNLPPGGADELTFFVACPGGSAPIPDTTTWTADSLRCAAREVWREWSEP